MTDPWSFSTWTFGGVDLSTLGNEMVLDEGLDIPARRATGGSSSTGDILIPFRDGLVFVEKYFDRRSIQFGIGVSAATPQDLEAAFDTIKTLVGISTQQALVHTMADNTVRQGLAVANKNLSVGNRTPLSANIVLELEMADPFFYSSVLTDVVTTIDVSPKTFVLSNPGHVTKRNPTISLIGPLNNFYMTTDDGVSLSYAGVIPAGHTVVISVDPTSGEFTAMDGDTNVIGNLSHSGNSAYFYLRPGDHDVSVIDDTHTTGQVEVSFYAPYL